MILIRKWLILLTFVLMLPVSSHASQPETCHYKETTWNTLKRRTSKIKNINKPYSELTKNETGPFNCTPCIEDQISTTLSNGVEFKICKQIAKQVKTVLESQIKNGTPIKTVVGYRVSRSRGPADSKGNRTLLSQHAFGVALDINENHNGLYTNCKTWGSHCNLIKGGRYKPKHPQGISNNSSIVSEFNKIGLNWGGTRPDTLKDFMHFSPNGL